MNDYTLYVGENCHECSYVVEFLDNHEINYRKINIDKSNEEPPIALFAFPALFLENQLLCYGSDIETYFKKKLSL